MNDMCSVSMVSRPESTQNALPPKAAAALSVAKNPESVTSPSTTTTPQVPSEDYSATIATHPSESLSSMDPRLSGLPPTSTTLQCALEWWNPAHHHARTCQPKVYGMPFEHWARYGK